MSAVPAPAAPRRRGRALWRWWPLAIIGLVVLVAVFAPLLAPYDPNQQNLLGRLKHSVHEAQARGEAE